MLGCTFKDMGSYISWAQLVAASGMIAVTYTNEDVEADAAAVFGFVRDRSNDLRIDPDRVGIWSCSGHGPSALALLMTTTPRCAALLYPYTLDAEGSAAVATAAAQFRFVNASAGKRITDLPRDVPIFLARAGQDRMPGLNESLDRFVAGALAANLPVSIVNHPAGPHAFDLHDDSRITQGIVRQTLEFLKFHLSP
jgi:acetyl esterase/lipase